MSKIKEFIYQQLVYICFAISGYCIKYLLIIRDINNPNSILFIFWIIPILILGIFGNFFMDLWYTWKKYNEKHIKKKVLKDDK